MTDREMLEWAAKAAGVDVWFGPGDPMELSNGVAKWPWNPLTDDGDALRLAVKCGIDAQTWALYRTDRSHDRFVRACVDRLGRAFNEPPGDDPYAATRRAIVRAAAEIGRAMAEGA